MTASNYCTPRGVPADKCTHSFNKQSTSPDLLCKNTQQEQFIMPVHVNTERCRPNATHKHHRTIKVVCLQSALRYVA